MNHLASMLAVTLLALSISLLAQEAKNAENPATSPPKAGVLLVEGTEVHLKLAQNVSSRAARPNEPIELSLAEDLKVGSVVVAKAGSRALGVVVQAAKPDFWGEAGGVNIRITFLKASGSKVPLRGAAGSAGTRYVVIRGSQAVLKTGTPVKAYVAEDTMISLK